MQTQQQSPAQPALVQILASSYEPSVIAEACQSESLKDFRHQDWYRELPTQAVDLWRTFSLEARAALLVMAEQLAGIRNDDLPGPDN